MVTHLSPGNPLPQSPPGHTPNKQSPGHTPLFTYTLVTSTAPTPAIVEKMTDDSENITSAVLLRNTVGKN